MVTTLQRSEVRAVSRMLKAKGMKLPKVGWCVRFYKSGENYRLVPYGSRYNSGICRDARGYYLTQSTSQFVNGYSKKSRKPGRK
jgi:hypothetical protein